MTLYTVDFERKEHRDETIFENTLCHTNLCLVIPSYYKITRTKVYDEFSRRQYDRRILSRNHKP